MYRILAVPLAKPQAVVALILARPGERRPADRVFSVARHVRGRIAAGVVDVLLEVVDSRRHVRNAGGDVAVRDDRKAGISPPVVQRHLLDRSPCRQPGERQGVVRQAAIVRDPDGFALDGEREVEREFLRGRLEACLQILRDLGQRGAGICDVRDGVAVPLHGRHVLLPVEREARHEIDAYRAPREPLEFLRHHRHRVTPGSCQAR